MRTAALILAGGKSSRFGSDKSRMVIDGRPLVERLASQCREVCGEVLIACGKTEKFHFEGAQLEGVREVPDIQPGQGPLGGIYAGMLASRAEQFLVLACDLPGFRPEAAGTLLALCEAPYDACVPIGGGRVQPLFAVYRRTVLPVIGQMLAEGEHRVRELLPRVHTRFPPFADDALFRNINTRMEYLQLCSESDSLQLCRESDGAGRTECGKN